MFKRGLLLSGVAAAILFTGCVSKKVEVEGVDAHEKLTIAQAEAIVDDRNRQIVMDVDKIARVVAILTKRTQALEDKINGVAGEASGVKGNSTDINLLKQELANLLEIKERYLKKESDIDELNKIKEEYLANKDKPVMHETKIVEHKEKEPKKKVRKTKKVSAPAVEEKFEDADGRVVVKYKNAFTRHSPTFGKKSKSTEANEGDIFTYVAKSENWYKLTSGDYISKTVVCETSLCAGVAKKGEPIKKGLSSKVTDAPKKVIESVPVKAKEATVPVSQKAHDIIKPVQKKQ